MKLTRLVCAWGLLFCVGVMAAPLSPEQKRADIEQLASMIRSHYGPYEFKKAHLGLDLGALVNQYVLESDGTTNLEFFHLINRFVAEFKDSHFGSQVHSSYLATVGIVADRIDGAVLIDQVDRNLLPHQVFPFERGDEIVSVDGVSADKVIAELARYIGMGNPESAMRMGAILIGYRPTALVPPPRAYVSVFEIRRGTSSIIERIPLRWSRAGELTPDSNMKWAATPRDYAMLSLEPVLAELPKTETSFRCSGITRTAIPAGAMPVILQPFVAYYHPTAKGNIGYLRIPHYWWGADSELVAQQYEYAIDVLEKNTVGLVIDQDHNCGGSVFFLEDMVAMFADKPFAGLEFQFLASRSEFLDFRSWINMATRFTLQGQDWMGVLSKVQKAWLSGDWLSEKTTFHNGRLLSPKAIRYTKPIVVLTDEMSGSGGDAFPALMQGLGRAKIMGSRTMGAGGHVVGMPPLNNSANSLRMTKSLFFRMDGVPVENHGVEPDVQYTPTRDDFMYQYRNYQKRYLEEILAMVE